MCVCVCVPATSKREREVEGEIEPRWLATFNHRLRLVAPFSAPLYRDATADEPGTPKPRPALLIEYIECLIRSYDRHTGRTRGREPRQSFSLRLSCSLSSEAHRRRRRRHLTAAIARTPSPAYGHSGVRRSALAELFLSSFLAQWNSSQLPVKFQLDLPPPLPAERRRRINRRRPRQPERARAPPALLCPDRPPPGRGAGGQPQRSAKGTSGECFRWQEYVISPKYAVSNAI